MHISIFHPLARGEHVFACAQEVGRYDNEEVVMA